MYRPFLPKTILKIQTALRSETLPLDLHLRTMLESAESKIDNGIMFEDQAMIAEGTRLCAEYAEQLRILANITPEAQAAFESSL